MTLYPSYVSARQMTRCARAYLHILAPNFPHTCTSTLRLSTLTPPCLHVSFTTDSIHSRTCSNFRSHLCPNFAPAYLRSSSPPPPARLTTDSSYAHTRCNFRFHLCPIFAPACPSSAITHARLPPCTYTKGRRQLHTRPIPAH
jgi:hypothetical protein